MATTFSRPGVFIQEVALPQSVALANNSDAIGAMVGSLPKGGTANPILVNSWSQFTSTFGGLNDSYPTTWAAYNFFANGGRNLYVKRVLGTSSAVGTLGITNTAVAAVFTINAINAGSWSTNYAVQVVPAGESTRFGVNVYNTVTQNGISVNVLVESFTDLSMSTADTNYFRSVINAGSTVITIPASGTNNSNFPVTNSSTPTALSGGSDGGAPSRTNYSDAWLTFDSISNTLVLYAPDAPYASTSTLTSQYHGDAAVYAATRSDCYVIIDTPSNLTVTAARENIDATKAIYAASTAGGIVSAYFPWINIPDGTKIPGATRLQAPGAAVLGQYLATDAVRGPAKTPAGLLNRIALAVSTERAFTNAELDTINTGTSPINAIRQVPGAGIVIMGGRTMDNTPNNRYINVRRSLMYISKQLEDLTAFAVFENNDSRLWLQIRTTLNSFLLNYWNNGGLRGASPTQAFYVLCDSTTTSFSDLQAGKVNIEVGVALQYPAEFVVIKLGQLTGNATA
jgi:hypothetical protein